jgi:diguanylate cyclase (GGDEF)-like protein/PAS domain S-box-containing protein
MGALRAVVTRTAPIGFVGAGSYVAWAMPEPAIAVALFFLGILSAHLSGRPSYTLVATIAATICLAIPHIAAQEAPNGFQMLWFGCLWFAAALLGWDPRRRSLQIEELEHAFAQSPAGLLIADLDGRVTHANHAIHRLLNAKSSETLGLPVQRLVPEDVWAEIEAQASESDEPFDVTFPVPSTDGTRAVEGHVSLTRNANGKPQHYVVQLNDLTQRQVAKRALTIVTKQLRRILSVTTDIVFVVDGNLHVTYANHRALEILGVDAASLNGQLILNYVATTEQRHLKESINSFRDSSEDLATVEALRFKSRQSISFSIEMVRLSDAANTGFALICHPSEDPINSMDRLKSSQERFSQVFHASPDAILIIRASDSLIIDFNDGFTRLLGYRREDAIGVVEADLGFWHNPVERAQVTEKLIAEREVIGHESTFRTLNGESVHVEISLRFIEADNELCVLCIGRDITKRISAEAALVETEEKFEKVFTQSPDGIVIVRQADGVVSDLNQAFLEHSGYRRDEIVGNSLTKLPVFHNIADLGSVTEELAQNGMFANRSITLAKKSGEPVPALISGTLLELSGEGYVMCIAKDMSEQQETEERLRRSEERFRGIFENAPIGILLVDLEGKIFQANRCAAELLSYPEEHLAELHLSRLVPQPDRRALKESFDRLQTGHAVPFRSERRLICQSGLEIWTNFHVVLQRSSTDEPLYYIVQVADITDLKVGQQRMEQMAFYDTLTNLANRRLFYDRLNQSIEHSLRSGKPAGLLYLDLDNFKRVNDTLGHEIGDALLREVAGRLKQCVRKEDTVARPGGDEFTILLNEVGTPSDAGMVAEKILNHLREPITISGHPLVVTTSIGITLLPSDGMEANVLTRNADLAMYKAKERGRNNYQFYSEDLNNSALTRLRTEYEIRQALDNDEFRLYYQPKVSLKSQRIVGVECLIRWDHPERGLISPDQFIEVAEETGSIIDIGSWVIEEACRAARILNNTHDRPVHISVNISPRQFRDPNLVTTIRRNIRETEMTPEHLELEITETMLMQEVDAAEETVRKLADLGVRLAIDDFGTGYSSLSYLKRFPINTVKVDKSFVVDIPQNQDDMAITRAVIAMAHQLKMEVVAEGVETREQLKFLIEQDCEYGQGYLFSRPLKISEINRLLEDDIKVLRAE